MKELNDSKGTPLTMKPVKKLNDNDVLFGRGEVACQYIGNRRFRDDRRFLELDSSAEALADIVADGIWYHVDEKKAIEKAKQTLRQIPVPTASKLPDNGPLSKADDMPATTVLSPIPTTICLYSHRQWLHALW